MKVGIVTFNQAINFGAHLQAYALQEYISSLGEEAYQVIIRNNHQDIFMPINNFHSVLANLRRAVFYSRFKRKLNLFRDFEKKYINYTDWIIDTQNASDYEDSFDCWVTGSDQVWHCAAGMNEIFFLEFVRTKKRIAYAASMGEPVVKKDEYERFCDALRKFNYISVREDSIKSLISQASNLNVSCVLDPVFLLGREHWQQFIKPIKNKYIFVYATQVSEELLNQINDLKDKTGYDVYTVHKLPRIKARILEYKSGPIEFLSYIANAQYIITSSFHCTAFSIIFEKNFVTISHSNTGARTNDLLTKFGIENDVAKSGVYNYFENYGYDYSKIREAMEHYVKKSKEFLNKALSD